MSVILEIDIGNTFLKWRLRDLSSGCLRSGRVLTGEALGSLVSEWGQGIDEVWIGSVAADEVNRSLTDLLLANGFPSPRFARTEAAAAGVINSYDNPAFLGVDRWLAMLAARQRAAGACCVVDCGSAITIDYLAADGRHMGGYILPGMRLLQRALLGNTARVFVDRPLAVFDPSPGRNTSDAVTHGADFMFDAIQLRLKQSLDPQVALYITGGDGELFQRLLGRGEWVPDLVLDGLQFALEG
ncbi:type III pantothenate kinase [Marinobacterium zhoushanense]|uniref:Type III pantothenate kinase n=1 Tax=Marinobacterium zhoushanense TaxID=1679163 RepID=A0ABQ1KXW5_9GAMM|nr:type III pantothenate kinase [Marinobacterium zhoushanense]GGC09775.1 type III pantothenate kinase [Marinobacterium zhoushanense]